MAARKLKGRDAPGVPTSEKGHLSDVTQNSTAEPAPSADGDFRDVTKDDKGITQLGTPEAAEHLLDPSPATSGTAPEPAAPKRRGRPFSDPAAGRKTPAQRAAKHRSVVKDEIVTLGYALSQCMQSMRRGGYAHELASMFKGEDGAALNAVIRHLPREIAVAVEDVELWAKSQLDELSRRFHEVEISYASRTNILMYKGRLYRIDKKGFVLRSGLRTGFRIKKEHPYFTVYAKKRADSDPRQHLIANRGEEMALLDAAILTVQRDEGRRPSQPIDYAAHARTPKRRKLPPPSR